jgi:hypothetical protein
LISARTCAGGSGVAVDAADPSLAATVAVATAIRTAASPSRSVRKPRPMAVLRSSGRCDARELTAEGIGSRSIADDRPRRTRRAPPRISPMNRVRRRPDLKFGFGDDHGRAHRHSLRARSRRIIAQPAAPDKRADQNAKRETG